MFCCEGICKIIFFNHKGAVALGHPWGQNFLKSFFSMRAFHSWYTCGLSWHWVSAMSVHYFWHRLRPHVYQWLDFFWSSCVMSSWSKTTCKSFVPKGDLMQQPLFNAFLIFSQLCTSEAFKDGQSNLGKDLSQLTGCFQNKVIRK